MAASRSASRVGAVNRRGGPRAGRQSVIRIGQSPIGDLTQLEMLRMAGWMFGTISANGSSVRPSLNWRHPSCSRSASTRCRISSRISRTRPRGLALGSSSGQSSRLRPGTTGHSSPHPMVIRSWARCAKSVVSFDVGAPDKSTPTSLMTNDFRMDARARIGAGRNRACLCRIGQEIKPAAAICDRPALWTHAKSTVFMMRTSRRGASRSVQQLAGGLGRATEIEAWRLLRRRAAR